jgi:hypothetical protein
MLLTDPQTKALRRAVIGALRSAIKDHGPITPEQVGSAAKRILGNLVNASDARDRRAAVRSRYRMGSGTQSDT